MEDGEETSSQKTQDVIRTGISLPKNLLEDFDSVLEGTRYMSRSRAIREAMRNFIDEYKELRGATGKQVGALMVLYDHTVDGVSDALTDLQHEYEETIIASIHVHLDVERCLEIIVVKGKGKGIKNLSSTIIGGEGIKEVKSLLIEWEGS